MSSRCHPVTSNPPVRPDKGTEVETGALSTPHHPISACINQRQSDKNNSKQRRWDGRREGTRRTKDGRERKRHRKERRNKDKGGAGREGRTKGR